MNKRHGSFYIYIDGQPVLVTEQVFRAYHYYERKEEYFSYDLKAEQFACDQDAQTAVFTPSREDSYDRLLKRNTQFVQDEPLLEDQVVFSVWLDSVLDALPDDERYVICEVVLKQRTEREVGAELGVSQNTIHYRKSRALNRLKKFLEKILKSIYQKCLPNGQRYEGRFAPYRTLKNNGTSSHSYQYASSTALWYSFGREDFLRVGRETEGGGILPLLPVKTIASKVRAGLRTVDRRMVAPYT